MTYLHEVIPADSITDTLVSFDVNTREFTFNESQITEEMRLDPYYTEYDVEITAETMARI